jgi:hypothetical protein
LEVNLQVLKNIGEVERRPENDGEGLGVFSKSLAVQPGPFNSTKTGAAFARLLGSKIEPRRNSG